MTFRSFPKPTKRRFKKEFRNKLEIKILEYLHKGMTGTHLVAPIVGFRHCPYNLNKPCKGIHKIRISNLVIARSVLKLFLDKIH